MARPHRKATQKSSKSDSSRLVEFPQARGRTIDKIELTANPDVHSVTIRFQDNTDLEILVDAAFTFKARLYDWKSGNQRELKRWPAIRSRIS